jgi:3-isopropylmalate/(R)-2-methylmalate dehydratase small subunit
MSKKEFHIVQGKAVLLPVDNIDTDQIIPARFLKRTTREGFGQFLFADWRADANGKVHEDFPLNKMKEPCEILVAGKNFGCGSSREHAAWAIADYGFRVVVASSFADIFKNNALNNGIVPVEVSPSFLLDVVKSIQHDPSTQLQIDLPEQKIRLLMKGVTLLTESFAINAYKKECLMHAYDDIDYLLQIKPEIEIYEQHA